MNLRVQSNGGQLEIRHDRAVKFEVREVSRTIESNRARRGGTTDAESALQVLQAPGVMVSGGSRRWEGC